MLVPVVLAGGSGTRLWPASRAARPKQFLPLVGQGSLLEQTLRRAAAVAPDGRPLIVGQERHRFLIAEHSRRAGATATVMLEPVGRNTAPAVAACAFEALASVGPEARLLVLPSDHVIGDAPGFARAVACAAAAARDGHLVTFGVTVTGPETGYGYIRAGEQCTNGAHRIEAFVEKPGRETAELYLADGGYYWNSGMFLFGAQVYLDALQALAPDILDAVRKAHEQASRETDFLRLEANAFAGCRPDSIDYAVMEKTRDAVVVPLSAPWSDLGSWSAVAAAGSLDGQGNALYGDVIVQETCDSIIRSDGRLVAALGVRDTVIVETPDAVLVADRSREQQIKTLVARLAEQNRSEASEHHKVYRPWGSYESIANGERFQVKRIVVTPGGRLSLQKHHHRAEHWVVVQGTARVTCDEQQSMLTENQSTYIPLGAVHRLENPGKLDLVLIEVQSGAYLGEDDIVRFDDVYGRADAEEQG